MLCKPNQEIGVWESISGCDTRFLRIERRDKQSSGDIMIDRYDASEERPLTPGSMFCMNCEGRRSWSMTLSDISKYL